MEKMELKYYNKKEVWENYDNNQIEINRAKKVITYIPKDVKSILDIGCGNGIITNMIINPFVIGLDFAKIPLSQLRTNAIQASIDNLPIKCCKFDLIILTEVLEHLNDEIYNNAINEIKRLKAKYLLITVPFDENLELGFCKCSNCGNIFNYVHHFRKFNNKFYKEFSEYELQKFEYDNYQIHPNKRLVKLKHKFGVYLYSDNGVCNKCGNLPTPPNLLFRYLFGGLFIFNNFINKILRIQKPYYQMVLLKIKYEN